MSEIDAVRLNFSPESLIALNFVLAFVLFGVALGEWAVAWLIRAATPSEKRLLDRDLTRSYHRYMETTKLSSKGQVVLPKSVRDAHGWGPGTEFIVEATPDGVRLRAKAPFARTDLDAIFGSVQHQGRPKSAEEMDAGIRRSVRNRYRRAVKR